MQANDTTEVIGEAAPGKKLPKVSVCVVTYNQEKYIAQCLQSIVDQETDFDFEIIVGEDCSTDGTREIVRGFAAKYPDKFRVLFHPQNTGPKFNYFKTHEMATGEYIAHIDGDDLLCEGKLQVQVDALDEHVECMVCAHQMDVIDENSNVVKYCKKKDDVILGLMDLIKTPSPFAHSSKMYRNVMGSNKICSDWKEVYDFDLHFAHAKNGKIIVLGGKYGFYRSNVGISFCASGVNPGLVNAKMKYYQRVMKDPSICVEHRLIKKYTATALLCYSKGNLLYGNYKSFRRLLIKSVFTRLISIDQILLLCVACLPDNVLRSASSLKSLTLKTLLFRIW